MKITKARLERAIFQGQLRAARDLAKFIPAMIRERTRNGLGLLGSLDGLSTSYVKFRERVKARLSKETSPNKSNLTATGQLLDAIIGEATGTIVKIFISPKPRKKELNPSANATNREIRKYVEEGGREFLGLTANERRVIEKEAAEVIKTEIRKAFK